jgi:hypothetical protein
MIHENPGNFGFHTYGTITIKKNYTDDFLAIFFFSFTVTCERVKVAHIQTLIALQTRDSHSVQTAPQRQSAKRRSYTLTINCDWVLHT